MTHAYARQAILMNLAREVCLASPGDPRADMLRGFRGRPILKRLSRGRIWQECGVALIFCTAAEALLLNAHRTPNGKSEETAKTYSVLPPMPPKEAAV